MIIKSGEIIVLNGDLPDPSLRPVGKIFVLKDGRRRFADDADASFIEQWEADKDDGAFDWDQCTLRELSALISPHLHKGTIEFVAAHVSRGLVRHERLLVRSDGSAEWHVCELMNDPIFADHWTWQGHGVLRSISFSGARGQRTIVFWGDQMAPPSGLRHTNLNGA